MPEFKGTPGPWENKPSDLVGPPNDPVAFIILPDDGNRGEYKANARAIAAVPKMIAALLKIRHAYLKSSSEKRLGEEITDLMEEINDVIIEAIGDLA